MADEILILIKSIFEAKGAQDAQKAVAALNTAMKGANTKAADPGFDKIASSAGKAALESSRLATQQQKTATAANQAAVAAQKLATEEQRTATAAAQAAAAQDRAAKSALSLAQAQSKANQSAQSGGSYFSQMGSTIQSSLLGIVGPAAIAGAAIAAIKGTGDLALAGAAISATRDSFTSLAAASQQSSATLLASMRAAAQGTISDAQLMQSANTGMLLTNGKIASELPKLIEIARASARATGQEVGFIFDSLVRGIARGSPMIIDNAGITLNASAAFETYAKSIGKSAEELTKAEQQQATLNAVVASGDDIIAKSGSSAGSASQSFAVLGTNLTNAKDAASSLLADGLKPLADLANAMMDSSTASKQMNADMDAMQGIQSGTAVTAAVAAEAQNAYTRAMLDGASQSEANAASQAVIAAATQNAAAATAMAAQTAAQDALEENRLVQSHAMLTSAAVEAAAATAAQTEKFVEQIGKTQESTLESQRLAQMQSTLANLGGAVAGGLMTAGNAALQMASQYGIAYSEAIRLINAQAALGQAKAAAVGLSDQRAGERSGGQYNSQAEVERAKTAERARAQAAAASAAAVSSAQRERTMAVGTAQQKIGLLNQEYQAAVKTYGAGSAEAIKAQTAILREQQSGAGKRAKAAATGANRLESIEQSTGNKIEDIVQKTQDKLIAIDKKAADERAKAARQLEAALRTSAASRRASNEADDLDLVGVKDPKEAAKLNDRERAQADSRKREVAAAAEARAAIEAGEAESGQKIYDIREQQIGDQESLDQHYYERQRELAGNKDAQAALKQQYDEATRANEEAAQVRIDLANAEAAEKAAAVQAEKDAVIAAAEDQMNQVVARSQQSAAGVKAASQSARDVAVANLRAIGDAVNAIPTEKVIKVTVQSDGALGTSATSTAAPAAARASGGDTNVGRVTLVGEQGPELVVFDQPGHVYTASQTQAMRQGGRIPAMGTGGVIDAGDGYTTPIAGQKSKSGGGSSKSGAAGATSKPVNTEAATKALQEQINFLKATAELAYLLSSPIPNLDANAVLALANETKRIGAIVGSVLVPVSKDNAKLVDDYDKAIGASVSILKNVQDLRKDLSDPQPPISAEAIQRLAQETRAIGAAVGGVLMPIAAKAMYELEDYEKAVSASVSILKDVSDLRKEVATPQPPIDPVALYKLAIETQRASGVIAALLIPYAKETVTQISDYETAVSGSVGSLKAIQDLRKELAAPQTPLDPAVLYKLAIETQRVSGVVASMLVPYSEETTNQIQRYEQVVGSSVSALKAVAELRKDMADPAPPLDVARVASLAMDTARVATIFASTIIPYSEETADQAGRYEQVVGAATSSIKSTLDLGGKLFADYVSPSDAQIALVVADADRVARGIANAAATYSTDGLEAGKLYAEGVGATFTAFKDGLLFFEALNSGDFVLDPSNLAKFEEATAQTMETARRLGAQAASIPSSDIAALQTTTAALTAQAEALIKLAAVPFGDLAGAASGLAQNGGALLGGAGGTTNIYNTFNLPNGTTQQLAQEVIRQLNSQTGARK